MVSGWYQAYSYIQNTIDVEFLLDTLGKKVFVVNKLHPNVGNLGWSVSTVVSNIWEFPVFMVPPEYFLVLPQLCMSDLT